MDNPFLKVYPITLSFELGRVDDPDDTGGRTKDGVTQKTYNQFRKALKRTSGDVFDMTDDERQAVYFQIWRRNDCDSLPWRLAVTHFDMAFHSGGVHAAKILQRALKVEDDGVIGSITIRAAVRSGSLVSSKQQLIERAKFLVRVILNRYFMFYKKTPDDFKGRKYAIKYAGGWFGRLFALSRITG